MNDLTRIVINGIEYRLLPNATGTADVSIQDIDIFASGWTESTKYSIFPFEYQLQNDIFKNCIGVDVCFAVEQATSGIYSSVVDMDLDTGTITLYATTKPTVMFKIPTIRVYRGNTKYDELSEKVNEAVARMPELLKDGIYNKEEATTSSYKLKSEIQWCNYTNGSAGLAMTYLAVSSKQNTVIWFWGADTWAAQWPVSVAFHGTAFELLQIPAKTQGRNPSLIFKNTDTCFYVANTISYEVDRTIPLDELPGGVDKYIFVDDGTKYIPIKLSEFTEEYTFVVLMAQNFIPQAFDTVSHSETIDITLEEEMNKKYGTNVSHVDAVISGIAEEDGVYKAIHDVTIFNNDDEEIGTTALRTDIPIEAGEGVSIELNEDGTKLVVNASGGGATDKNVLKSKVYDKKPVALVDGETYTLRSDFNPRDLNLDSFGNLMYPKDNDWRAITIWYNRNEGILSFHNPLTGVWLYLIDNQWWLDEDKQELGVAPEFTWDSEKYEFTDTTAVENDEYISLKGKFDDFKKEIDKDINSGTLKDKLYDIIEGTDIGWTIENNWDAITAIAGGQPMHPCYGSEETDVMIFYTEDYVPVPSIVYANGEDEYLMLSEPVEIFPANVWIDMSSYTVVDNLPIPEIRDELIVDFQLLDLIIGQVSKKVTLKEQLMSYIEAGEGVSIEPNEDGTKLIVSASGGGGSSLYQHRLVIYMNNYCYVATNIFNKSSSLIDTKELLNEELLRIGAIDKTTMLQANGTVNDQAGTRHANITGIYRQDSTSIVAQFSFNDTSVFITPTINITIKDTVQEL